MIWSSDNSKQQQEDTKQRELKTIKNVWRDEAQREREVERKLKQGKQFGQANVYAEKDREK